MNFGGKILKLAIFRYCTLYKYIPIPFLLVIYIRKNNSPISLFMCQFYRKGDLEFPNGKSFEYSRPIGRFYGNTQFSTGDFKANILNIGLLDLIFTFVFCFHLKKNAPKYSISSPKREKSTYQSPIATLYKKEESR